MHRQQHQNIAGELGKQMVADGQLLLGPCFYGADLCMVNRSLVYLEHVNYLHRNNTNTIHRT